MSCTDRFLAPVKDVFFVPYYLSQGRSLDEATGLFGEFATDVLTGVSIFSGTDEFLADRVPGAAGALLGKYVGEKITGYEATLMARAAADELIRKRIATMSVFEKIVEVCMQQSIMKQSISIPGMSIMYFFSFKANILITGVAVGVKVLLKPFKWRRKKRLRRVEACNAIKKIFKEDAIDVDFWEE